MQKNIQIQTCADFEISVNNYRALKGYPKITASTQQFTIGIKELITIIGMMQTRRKITNRTHAFNDKSDLLEYILSDSDLKIELSAIRRHSPEVLRTISEDFGVGLGVLALHKIVGIDWSSFSRIGKSKLRSDFKCKTKYGERLVIECKGKAEREFSKKVIAHAIKQKKTEPSEFCAVSLTKIFENQIVSTKLIDPENDDTILENSDVIYRADHYAFVFDWLGDVELSRYFELVAQRARTGVISEERQNLYEKIRNSYYELSRGDDTYLGKVLLQSDRSLQFIGFDKRLLNYNTFLRFPEYNRHTEDREFELGLFNDGVLVIENFRPSVELSEALYFRVFPTSLEEMDEMSPMQFIHSIMNVISKYSDYGVYTSDLNDGLMRIFIDSGEWPQRSFVIIHSKMDLYKIDIRNIDAPVISNLDLTLIRPVVEYRIIDRDAFKNKLVNEKNLFRRIMG
jgi:hypothetical protein